jgi:hypothetical protein
MRSRSYLLTSQQVETVTNALRFARFISSTDSGIHYSLAPADYSEAVRRDRKVLRMGGLADETPYPPEMDYTNGDEATQLRREETARMLLSRVFV